MAYIRKPININGQWAVQIAESRSPLAKVLEEYKSPCYATAYKVYQKWMKESGHVETWDLLNRRRNEKSTMEE